MFQFKQLEGRSLKNISPDIFQAYPFQLLKLENLLQWSFFTFICNHSTIWISYIFQDLDSLPFSIYILFRGFWRSPNFDLHVIFRILTVSLFPCTCYLQNLDSLPFSIYMLFAGSSSTWTEYFIRSESKTSFVDVQKLSAIGTLSSTKDASHASTIQPSISPNDKRDSQTV